MRANTFEQVEPTAKIPVAHYGSLSDESWQLAKTAKLTANNNDYHAENGILPSLSVATANASEPNSIKEPAHAEAIQIPGPSCENPVLTVRELDVPTQTSHYSLADKLEVAGGTALLFFKPLRVVGALIDTAGVAGLYNTDVKNARREPIIMIKRDCAKI